MMSDELKRCPFCGQDARVYRMHNGNYFCGCSGASDTGICCDCVIRATEELAVTAWNRRVKD